jgi:hypothetical protein
MRANRLPAIALTVVLCACSSVPKGVLALSDSSTEDRERQSRVFHDIDEQTLLRSGASVLQDLGYVIDESSNPLGLITASRQMSAIDGTQVALAILFAAFGANASVDHHQKVDVSLVVHTASARTTVARLTLQRTVYDASGAVNRTELLAKDEVYREFFARLAQAVALSDALQ